MCADFALDKKRVLGRVDLSRKGSVDAAILPLLDYLNGLDCYYSTSSCSGRLVVFAEGGEQKKKGCQWLLVSHDPLEPAQLEEVLRPDRLAGGYVYFKFEPFVLHVMCASLPDAKLLLQAAVAAGFRNSGLSCGKRERWLVAVRSTHSLEVPLAHNTSLLTPTEYLRHVVDIGNAKLKENLRRIERFHQELIGGVERRQTDHHPKKTKPDTRRAKTNSKPDCISSQPEADENFTDVEISALFSQH